MVRTTVHKARSDQEMLGKTRSCSVSEELADRMGITPIQHVRIDSSEWSMYCLVKSVHEESDYPLRMPKATRERFGFTHRQSVRLSKIVPREDYMTARRTGGFAETVWDDGRQDTLLLMSLHGGDVEFGTDDVPIRCYKKLQREGLPASVWMCHGFNNSFESDAYTNWHTSKPCRSIDSYPGLTRVADRRYDYAVSIHVQGKDAERDEYYIGVGGRIDESVRTAVAERLRDRTGKTVETDHDEMKWSGTHELNAVNHLSKAGGGLQLELTPGTAYRYRKAVARTIYDVFSDLIGEGGGG
jgi:phage replication-related protein YjqB (UPF0714/DUF867 family)